MNEITEKDIALAIQLKNHLLTFSPEQLKSTYGTKEGYLLFLDTIVVLTSFDQGFFLLDNEIIDRIRKILEFRRDEYNSGDVLECINSIIRMCNHIENVDDNYRKLIMTQYIYFQSSMRNVEISSKKQMFDSIIYDARVYYAIVKNDWEGIDQEGYILSSIMYLSEHVPSIFVNEEYRRIVIDKLEKIIKKKGIFRKPVRQYSKSVVDTINSIYEKKGE